jgi:hypothetical protein
MNAQEIIKFLELLRETACIDKYWKNRINDMIQRLGGKV